MNNTSTPASASAMIQFNPLMPVSLVVLYWCLSAAILILCVVSSVAMGRTKRTSYTAKLLSLGLLIYNILFLILSPVSKLFDFNDVYLIWHAIRGFQIAAQVVVASMSIERLAVFNWPYEYLRVMTKRRTKTICIAVCTFGYLHYAVMRGVFCYASDTVDNCGLGFPIYLIAFCIVVPTVSFICFVKIYKIIRNSEDKHRSTRQYKGTVAAFLVLVNTTFSQLVLLGLAVFNFTRKAKGVENDGLVSTLADWSNLINCTIDPMIYVLWFGETRMEVFKIVQGVCPFVQPKIEQLRVEIYHLDFHPREPGDLVVEYRAMDPEVVVSNPINQQQVECSILVYTKEVMSPS